MPDYSTQGVLGTSIQTGEIDNLAVTGAKIADATINITKLDSSIMALIVGLS